ncbi:hypothetical protein QBC40DRAFT_285918 [Triangularia verruculosa]|uniref:Uncharacterized protein n=1 Tax=Triangularia verruculosa TaxID=2587418 RepID=A0AAN7AS20_9PEZI|nr:hypothetical protein QBC40DRAFT_285918 [Triangularia verruculosa]
MDGWLVCVVFYLGFVKRGRFFFFLLCKHGKVFWLYWGFGSIGMALLFSACNLCGFFIRE